MTNKLHVDHSAFCPLDGAATHVLPAGFHLPKDHDAHPLCLLAARELQEHLQEQQEWEHNFGLSVDATGPVIGKMFGVLVVRNAQNELGYLSAFSGKLANGNYHAKFVPPIYDGMAEHGFLTIGMRKLSSIGLEISELESLGAAAHREQINQLKASRKALSNSLQKEIFDQYHFLNQAGETQSLVALFENASYKNPPAGAGECAAPKLMQYAFQQGMQPIALAEFWWGLSPKSDFWKHGEFYPPCREKCAPILSHMLSGLAIAPH
jgi:tRNA pseudouridine32 synthase/23S rRNA pseudouridine746 synthase